MPPLSGRISEALTFSHTRQREQPLANPAQQFHAPVLPGQRPFPRDEKRQQSVRLVARLDAAQRQEAAKHQARPDQQHERKRHFRDHHAISAECGPRPEPCVRPPRSAWITSGRAARTRRQNSKDGDSRQAGRSGEDEYPPVHGRGVDPRQVRGRYADQEADTRRRYANSQSRTEAGEEQRFSQCLGHQAPPASAKGRAHRQFAFPRGCAHQQQVGHVGAGDQEQEQHRPHQREDGGPHVLHQVVAHGLEPQRRSRVEELLAQFRMPGASSCVWACSTRGAALQAADGSHRQEIAMGRVVPDVVGDPEIRSRVGARRGRKEQAEAGGKHSDDARTALSERGHFLAEHRGAAAVPPLPVFIAQDGSAARRNQNPALGRLRHRVGVREVPADGDPGAHQPEEVGGDQRLAELLRTAVFARNERAEGGDSSEIVENGPRAVAKVREIGVGVQKAAAAGLLVLRKDQHQAVRVAVRKRLEQNRVGHAEDRGAGADSERERGGRRSGKNRALSQAPGGISEIVNHIGTHLLSVYWKPKLVLKFPDHSRRTPRGAAVPWSGCAPRAPRNAAGRATAPRVCDRRVGRDRRAGR